LWRLSINPEKFQYIIFEKGPSKNNKNDIKLKLFNQEIPKVKEVKSLGLTLDNNI
jgi:hypothetical protein